MQPRRVLMRVDASESIGTGHAVRCIALSQELASRDIEPWFASRPGTDDRPDQIGASGSPVIHIEGPPSAEVAAILGRVPRTVRRRPFAALVMDHYGLGSRWLNAARPLATRRLVIDDLADRPLPCELLVNANLGVSPGDYASLVGPGTVMLLGVRYLLLRPSFRTARAAHRRPAGTVERVLVTMGGSDPSHVTAVAVTAVRSALPAARIDVVLGALYRGQRQFGPGVRVHEAIGEGAIAQLMASADMAVGAGGTSAWERCAIGLPTVTIRLAPNQDEVAARLDAAGAAVDAGSATKLEIATLSRRIGQLANDQARREAMGDRARTLVDGRGTERVAHHLDGVRVRRASMADARLLWQWANDPETRSASFRTERIPYADHVAWLKGRLSDRSCLLLVGENGAGSLGQVRFDHRDGAVEVSISVAAEHRGTVGRLLLETAVNRARRLLPGARLVARVKVDNAPSRRLFESAGFRLIGDRRGALLYDRPR